MIYFENEDWFKNPWPLYPDLLAQRFQKIDGNRIAIFRYQDVRDLIQHPDLSAQFDPEPHLDKPLSFSMTNRDDPDHFRLRRPTGKSYNKKPIEELESFIRNQVRQIFRSTPPTKGFEFIHDFSKPLTLQIFKRFSGLPEGEAQEVANQARAFMSRVGITVDWEPQRDALLKMRSVYSQLWEGRIKQATPGLVQQVFGMHESGVVSFEEMMDMLLLLTLGTNETMTNLIGLSLMYLEIYPDLRASVFSDINELPAFIDEVIRIDSPVRASGARRAVRDIDMNGLQIEKGSLVYLVFSVANHDPDVFEDPDTFKLNRQGKPHLGFGFGRHHCLGSHLAKSTIRIILEELHHAFPNWKISNKEFPLPYRFLRNRPQAPWTFLDWRNSQQIRGLETIRLNLLR